MSFIKIHHSLWRFLYYNSYLNPLTPKIIDFLIHFCPLLPMRKREYIMTKPCIFNIFGSSLSIYEVKITLPCTGKPIWRILFEKSTKNLKFFFYCFFFKWIKHIDLFQTMDKGGQNSCSLWKILFGPAPYVLSFPKWRKTMEVWKIGVFLWHF